MVEAVKTGFVSSLNHSEDPVKVKQITENGHHSSRQMCIKGNSILVKQAIVNSLQAD